MNRKSMNAINANDAMTNAVTTAAEHDEFPAKRLNLYNRYLDKMFDQNWEFNLQGNKMVISKV